MDNKNYLKDEQVKKNLEEFHNNKEEFLKNANVLDFDKSNSASKEVINKEQVLQNEKLNNEQQKIEEEKSIKNKEEYKHSTRNIIIIYLVTMVIFPAFIYVLLQNKITIIENYSGLPVNPPGGNIIYEQNIKLMLFIVFLLFDTIFTFLILKKSHTKKIRLIIAIIISPIIKIAVVIALGRILNIFYSQKLESIINSILIGITIGKTEVGNYSYGIYLGIILAKIFNKQRKNK